MRTVLTPASYVLVGCLAAILFLNVSLLQMWLYPAVREVTIMKTNYETQNMLVMNTEHFQIKYTAGNEQGASTVAQAAESAYAPVSDLLGFSPRQKVLILVHPDKDHLNQAFGWTNGQGAMGVYWGGVIQVLSPDAWRKNISVDEFIQQGPVLHEYTHLVFDYMARGNYPRWFTEGLAQYAEYKINDYEWLTQNNRLTGELYTMHDLRDNFDGLDNRGLSYREAFAAIRYIVDVQGEDKLKEIVSRMQKGQNADKAIEAVLNMTAAEYEQAWQEWAKQTMEASL